MTCIVGLTHGGNVYIGGDTQGTAYHSKQMRLDKKVFISHGIAYGFTHSFRMGQILQFHTKEIKTPIRRQNQFRFVVECLIQHYREILKEHSFTTVKDNVELGGNFLIGFDNLLFCIQPDFQVAHINNTFVCLGSGDDLATGAMEATNQFRNPRIRIRNAINIASKYNTTVSNKVNIVKV